MEHSRFSGTKASLIMFDIDHFKQVNDTKGHRTGDLVLKQIAEIVSDLAKEKEGAFAGRWGGEEFFLVLPDTDRKEGLELAEQFRKAVEAHDFGDDLRITISLGYIEINGNEDLQQVYQRVDHALYDVKEEGRNSVHEAK